MRSFRSLVAAALILVLLSGCSVLPGQSAQRQLSIATGETAGVYYPYGAGLAGVIGKYVPNVTAQPVATAGSVENLRLVKDGKAGLAFVMGDIAYAALQGSGDFQQGGKVPVRALAVLYSNHLHVVARQDAGIKAIADLKGRKVSTGAQGSGTEVLALRLLQAFDLDSAKDLQRSQLGLAESAAALKGRQIEAFFWAGGLPTPAIADLASAANPPIVLLSHADALKKMTDAHGPVYFQASIPKGAYAGQDAAVPVAGVANLLVVNENADGTLVRAILEAMFGHQGDLVVAHPEAKNLALASAVQGSSVPYHPAAIEFYKQKGVWK